MGLSFHYSGSFRRNASLSDMIEEVKDISEINKWHYSIFKKEFLPDAFGRNTFSNDVYGITFSPPECEPVWLCFLSNGKLCSPVNLQLFGRSEDNKERKFLHMLSTKTQYAGIQAHIQIIDLLKYLKEKYFEDLQVSDEGKYWETGDEKILQAIFKRYNDALDLVSDAVENTSRMPHESFEDYFKRILKDKGNR
ncbi:MAG: hypothetical protein WEB30_00095 [Cyclobacteriaceae bacterium]